LSFHWRDIQPTVFSAVGIELILFKDSLLSPVFHVRELSGFCFWQPSMSDKENGKIRK
jgi:hypothetical protein